MFCFSPLPLLPLGLCYCRGIGKIFLWYSFSLFSFHFIYPCFQVDPWDCSRIGDFVSPVILVNPPTPENFYWWQEALGSRNLFSAPIVPLAFAFKFAESPWLRVETCGPPGRSSTEERPHPEEMGKEENIWRKKKKKRT